MDPRPPKGNDLQKEVSNLTERYGKPEEELIRIHQLSHTRGPAGFPLSSRRTAEVVLIVPRPQGKVLIHTKSFYPSGVWRLPTGGLHPGEAIEGALLREGLEETGHLLPPVRFLFYLRFQWEGSPKEFRSYGFLTATADGRIASRDPREQITAFRDAGRREIAMIVERLETLSGSWSAWGRFRAAPHRALLKIWPETGELDAGPAHEPLPPNPPSTPV